MNFQFLHQGSTVAVRTRVQPGMLAIVDVDVHDETPLERRQRELEEAEARDAREAYAARDSSDREDARLSNLPHDA